MADNVDITVGAGTPIAADEIGGIFHQRVKLQHGLDGAAVDASALDPVPVREQALDARFKTYSDASFVTGDSPVVVDVNTDLGRDGRSFTFLNDGAGDIGIEVSNDGATYSDMWTTKAGEQFGLGDLRVDSIRITWVADSSYRLMVI